MRRFEMAFSKSLCSFEAMYNAVPILFPPAAAVDAAAASEENLFANYRWDSRAQLTILQTP